jgi:hypothetical protein
VNVGIRNGGLCLVQGARSADGQKPAECEGSEGM